tara:strand:- start:87 stop:632 length:546 start_codon:yes stop_codon:yes gene_type:complete
MKETIIKIWKKNPERFLLPFTTLSFLFIDEKINKDPRYVSIITFFLSLIIFSNFPFLVTHTTSKPLYFEDLYVDSEKLPQIPLTDQQKKLHKRSLHSILITSHSLLMCSIANYWLFKTDHITSYYEIMGVIGGLLKVASVFNQMSGKFTLYLIRACIHAKVSEISIETIIVRSNSFENEDV